MNRPDVFKYLSALMTGIIYVGIGFAAGFGLSEIMGKDSAPPVQAVSTVPSYSSAPASPPPTPSFTPSPEPEYYGIRYLIRAEDDELRLYETEGSSKKILRKSKINMNSFPAADKKELENGINTGTLEHALEIWEGFSE